MLAGAEYITRIPSVNIPAQSPGEGRAKTLKHGYGNVLGGPLPPHLLMLSEFIK